MGLNIVNRDGSAPVPDVALSPRARQAIAGRQPAELTPDEQMQLGSLARARSAEAVKQALKARDQMQELARTVVAVLSGVNEAQLALDATTSSIAASNVVVRDEAYVLLRISEYDYPRVSVVGIYASKAGAEAAAMNWPQRSAWREAGRSASVERPEPAGGYPYRWESEAPDRRGEPVRYVLEKQVVTK